MNFEELSYPESPKINSSLPGVKTQLLLEKQRNIEGSAVSYPKGIPLALKEGRGATLMDMDGNIFIDFFAGAGVIALGHCNPIINNAVQEQQKKITHTLDFPTEIRLDLIEKIHKIMPKSFKTNIKIQFGGPTGSDAVEMAIKLVKYQTKCHSLLSFEGSYHGMSSGALSLTSGRYWKEKYSPLLPEVHFIPYAYCYRCSFSQRNNNCNLECSKYYQHVLDDPHSGVNIPAAAIIEPIQGEGGSIVPPNEYIKEIARISNDYNIPIIFDEIQSGFCRTGEFFAFQHSKAIPDIITISKALGGGFPLSAIVFKEDLDGWRKGSHIGTFRGNVTAMAAGAASIDFMVENRINDHVNQVGKYLLDELKTKLENNFTSVGEVRGKGLMIGIEIIVNKEDKIPSAKLATLIRKECYTRGLLVEIGGHYDNVIRLLPPLIITKRLVKKGIEIIIESVEEVEKSIN